MSHILQSISRGSRLTTYIFSGLLIIALVGVLFSPPNFVLFFAFFTAILSLMAGGAKFLSNEQQHIVTKFAVRLNQQLIFLTTPLLRKYYQYIIYENQIFDVKGLSTRTVHDLDLEQIFVELNVDPTPIHQANVDPFKIPEPLRGGFHTIWDFLSAPELQYQPLVIVGAPGSGKTTLLKHLAITLARRKQNHDSIRQIVPILLYLREHANTIKENPTFSLVDVVQEHMKRGPQRLPPQQLAKFLAQGHCLILLDGLDEVANEALRKEITAWVQRQIRNYEKNRFIITSRPYGYRTNPLNNVILLEIRLFTSRQVERFIQNWYLANELKSWGKDDPGVHMRAYQGAQDLLRSLHRVPTLATLAVNPLLLTMIATVHRYRGSLPGKRVALYAEICEVFLGKRYEARSIAQQLNSTQKQYVLQTLAYYLMQHGMREISFAEICEVIQPYVTQISSALTPQEFISMVENTSGLLLERDTNFYAFAHLTFQEYLASVHIKEHNLVPELLKRVGESWWSETIHLYSAQADATSLIASCLEYKPSSAQTLALALECYEEALLITANIRGQLNWLLETDVEDPDPERRHIIASTLLKRRLSQMVQLSNETSIDTSLITCAEYQLFLDEQREFGKFYQPNHWLTHTFAHGQGHTPILGIRHSDADVFCTWLTERDSEGWSYRLPTLDELKLFGKNPLPRFNLKPGTGYWINEATHSAHISNKTHCVWVDDISPFANIPLQIIHEQFNSDRARARDLDLARDLIHGRDLTDARDLASDLIHAIDLDLDLDLGRAHLDLDLGRLDLGRTYTFKKRTSSWTLEDQEASFQYVRSCALALASLYHYWNIILRKTSTKKRKWIEKFLQMRSQNIDQIEYFSIFYLDTYISLLQLKLRTEGKIPAWEGILIVKMRS